VTLSSESTNPREVIEPLAAAPTPRLGPALSGSIVTCLLALVLFVAAMPIVLRDYRVGAAGYVWRTEAGNQILREALPRFYATPPHRLAQIFAAASLLTLVIGGAPYLLRAGQSIRRRRLDADLVTAIAVISLALALIVSFTGSAENFIFTSVEIAAALALVRLRDLRVLMLRRVAGRQGSAEVGPAGGEESSGQKKLDRFERALPWLLLTLAVAAAIARWLTSGSIELILLALAGTLLCSSVVLPSLANRAVIRVALVRSHAAGIVFNGGSALARLGRVRRLFVRRRGVVIEREAPVSDFVLLRGNSQSEILRLASALTQRSSHPLARILTRRSTDSHGAAKASRWQVLPSEGISGIVDGNEVFLAQPAAFRKRGIDLSEIEEELGQFAKAGKNVLVIRAGGRLVGALALEERLRPDATAAIARMKALGIKQVLRSAGEPSAVQAIAERAGIREIEDHASSAARLDPASEARTAVVSFGAPAAQDGSFQIMIAGSPETKAPVGLTIEKGGLGDVARALDLAQRAARRRWRNLAIWVVLTLAGAAAGSGLLSIGIGERPFLLTATCAGALAALLTSARIHLRPRGLSS